MTLHAYRILKPDDARSLAMIHAEVFRTPWSPASFRSELAKPTTFALGLCSADDQSEIVSFVLFQRALDEAEMLTIATVRANQRSGLAKVLLETAFDHLKQRAIVRVLLDVAEDNAGAISLYAKLGFHEDSRRKAYYKSPGMPAKDAILMSRDMTGLP